MRNVPTKLQKHLNIRSAICLRKMNVKLVCTTDDPVDSLDAIISK